MDSALYECLPRETFGVSGLRIYNTGVSDIFDLVYTPHQVCTIQKKEIEKTIHHSFVPRAFIKEESDVLQLCILRQVWPTSVKIFKISALNSEHTVEVCFNSCYIVLQLFNIVLFNSWKLASYPEAVTK